MQTLGEEMVKVPEVGDIIACKWLDAHANAKEELSQDEVDKMGSYQFTTWGVLARDDRGIDRIDPLVAIAAEVGEDGRYRGVTFIPATWVVSLSLIKKKKAKRKLRIKTDKTNPAG